MEYPNFFLSLYHNKLLIKLKLKMDYPKFIIETLDQEGDCLIVGECIGCKTKRDSLSARITGQTPEYFEGNTRPPGSDIVIF